MRRTSAIWFIVLTLLATGVWIYLGKESIRKPPASEAQEGSHEKQATQTALSTKTPDTPLSLPDFIARCVNNLRNGNFVEGEIEALRQRLLSAPPDESVAAIQAFLATGRDAFTGEGFAVLNGGGLGGAPTMRILLLDMLGRICQQHDRPEAVQQAKTLLERKTSADEWAVALRNVGWGDPNAKPYLASKMREMLSEQAWRQQPSEGYLEAFDVIVFTRDAQFVDDLAEMIAQEKGPLKRASAVALDRLSAQAPLDVMTRLNSNPKELADRPFLRADYFAKADLSQTAQLAAVETYLDRQDVALGEKTKFFKAIIAPGEFVSDNLLTPAVPPEDSPQRAQILQQTVQQWQKNNRFPELRPALDLLGARLGNKPAR